MMRDSGPLRASLDCEINHDRRSPSTLVVTVELSDLYHFSQSEITISSLLVQDVKSFMTVDILGSQPWLLDAFTF